MTAASDLEAGVAPERLISGNVGELERAKTSLARVGNELADTARGISYIQLDGRAWSGQAARAYDAAREIDIAGFKAATAIFDEAQAVVSDYLVVLASARRSAAIAAAAYATGKAKRDADLASCTPPPPADPTRPYDPYGLQAAASSLEQARAEVSAASHAAAHVLRQLAALAPGDRVAIPDADVGLRDIATAPWHLAHGAFEIVGNSFVGLGYVGTPLAGLYSDKINSGVDEEVPAMATLASLALMAEGVRGGFAGKPPLEAPPVEQPGLGRTARGAGWLNDHEAAGGHAIERHVGKSDAWLRQRIADEGMRRASSFDSREIAESAIGTALDDHAQIMASWLESGASKLEFDQTVSGTVGRVCDASGACTDTNAFRVVLRRSADMPDGYYVRTAFPQPRR